MDRISRRTRVLNGHLVPASTQSGSSFGRASCLGYSAPELTEKAGFDTSELRSLTDGHNLEDRDRMYGLMIKNELFNPRSSGGRVFVSPGYDRSMEEQREMTMRRIEYLLEQGFFRGWLTDNRVEAEMRKFAFIDVFGMFDYSLVTKIGVNFFLWGGAIQFLGTKRHEKWLKDSENYKINGCFAMTELGHGSNVRGIETVATYDVKTGEFVINTPCESAQKYWIGGAANHATHTVAFSQLIIDGINQGVHAFIVRIRDSDGNICPNVRVADCGHKIGLNGVDNGRIWFDNVRIPRENLLNSVADVSPDGQYLSAIKDPDQRFIAFLAPLMAGRVNIAAGAIYCSKIGLAIAIRYALSRRAFSVEPNEPEMLLLDYPSHQRRLLPLLAKTYAMSFSAIYLKKLYWNRTPESNRTIHIVSSAYKAAFTWHNMRTLQECREACGGQGLKTENHVGHFKSEFDVQLTFEGDNNVLMQQISKALFTEYVNAKKRNKPLKGLGLEHMDGLASVVLATLPSSTLRSKHFQTEAFRLRERDLLYRFGEQVLQLQSKGQKKDHAFMLSYQLAEDLGRAFSDRAVLQNFLEVEESVHNGPLKDVLHMLRSMYALIIMEEDSAFLRYGYLSTDNALSIRKEISILCSELRPHALALVDSFGIPDALLSPIAFNWVDANAWTSVIH